MAVVVVVAEPRGVRFIGRKRDEALKESCIVVVAAAAAAVVKANSDMTDSVGPGKLVRHMQSLSYAYDRLSPSYVSL